MSKHLKPLIEKLSNMPVVEPPPPWERKAIFKVGGLRSVGFDADRDLLLVVSSDGRGVIDCLTGRKMERDRAPYYEGEERLEAEGIGPLSGTIIRMAGLFGGGLPTVTVDRWRLTAVTLNWPDQLILLVEPGSDVFGSLQGQPDQMSVINRCSVLLAYGFSYTGKTFAIATSSDVAVYSRG